MPLALVGAAGAETDVPSGVAFLVCNPSALEGFVLFALNERRNHCPFLSSDRRSGVLGYIAMTEKMTRGAFFTVLRQICRP